MALLERGRPLRGLTLQKIRSSRKFFTDSGNGSPCASLSPKISSRRKLETTAPDFHSSIDTAHMSCFLVITPPFWVLRQIPPRSSGRTRCGILLLTGFSHPAVCKISQTNNIACSLPGRPHKRRARLNCRDEVSSGLMDRAAVLFCHLNIRKALIDSPSVYKVCDSFELIGYSALPFAWKIA